MTFNLSEAIPILERTPKLLRLWLEGLSDNWIRQNEGGDTWSPYDVVGHLIHGEKTDWMQRLQKVLNEGEDKTFEPFDRFAQFEDSKGKSLDELLNQFETLRAENVRRLRALNISEDQFDLKAIHPSLGEVTLGQLLSTWVTHDLSHIGQIARVMAKQYKNEVGPWQAYIGILNK